MKRVYRAIPVAALVTAAVCVVPAGAYPRPGTTERVSVATDGTQGNGSSGDSGSDSAGVAMTPDGRYVAFTSDASNLVPGDVNGGSDVFVHDRATGKTSIASVPSSGAISTVATVVAGACGAVSPSISDNGRYVAFASCYPYLDGESTANVLTDVFVHDMRTGRTTRVSVTYDGKPSLGFSGQPSISGDGRYVAFESNAGNILPDTCPSSPVEDTWCLLGTRSHVYVRDLRKSVTTLVSVAGGGGPADGSSMHPSISRDGRLVAFTSDADDLTTNDHNTCLDVAPSCSDVYLRDLRHRTTQLISVGLNGSAPAAINAGGISPGAGGTQTQRMISADDRYVVFYSGSAAYVPDDGPSKPTGSYNGVYVRDLLTRRTARVSVDSTGTSLDPGAGNVGLDASGRYVVFAGDQTGCSTGVGFIDAHDQMTGATYTVTRTDYRGQPSSCEDRAATSDAPVPSANGRLVAFFSLADYLVRGDTNGHWDVFVRNIGRDLGVGELVRSDALMIEGSSSFASTGVASGVDVSRDVSAALSAQGANLIGATLAYRAHSRDLFFRLPVQQMPLFTLADPALVYGVNLTIHGARYQVRAAKTGPLTASFGLFRRGTGNIWTQVATLKGGYGTTGQEVVVALPLRDIGATRSGRLTHVVAFTGLGGYYTGATTVVDRVAIGATP